MVRVVVASAKGGGNAVQRPWLGAKLQVVTSELADSLGLPRPIGVLVANVTPNSPAARGGLKTGDVITAVDSQPVDDPNAFDYRFGTKPLGGSAKLAVIRDGRETSASVPLQLAPAGPRDEIVIKARSPFAGAKVGNLSPALADELRLIQREGVPCSISPCSTAQQFGFPGAISSCPSRPEITARDLKRDASRYPRRCHQHRAWRRRFLDVGV